MEIVIKKRTPKKMAPAALFIIFPTIFQIFHAYCGYIRFCASCFWTFLPQKCLLLQVKQNSNATKYTVQHAGLRKSLQMYLIESSLGWLRWNATIMDRTCQLANIVALQQVGKLRFRERTLPKVFLSSFTPRKSQQFLHKPQYLTIFHV